MRSASSRLLFLAMVLAACGEPVPSLPVDGGRRDARPSVDDDAGPLDAARPDAPPQDGGPGVDSGPMVDPGTCTFDPGSDVIESALDTMGRERLVSAAAGDTDFAVTWQETTEGFQNIWWRTIPSTGDVPAPRPATTSFGIDAQPAVVAIPDGWMLAWYGTTVDGGYDIHAQAFEPDGTPRGTVQRLTTRPERDDNPALLARAGSVLASWVQVESDVNRIGVTRVLEQTALPRAAARTVTAIPRQLSTPVLAERGTGASLLWVQGTDALLQPLDAAGASAGMPRTVSSEGNADGTIDATGGAAGGVVVFGALVATNGNVRARAFDEEGDPVGDERWISSEVLSARDPSIAPFAGGYVVAYRATEGPRTLIRVAFVERSLDVAARLDLVDAAPTGGRTSIRVNGEGRILVVWNDVESGGSRVRAVRVRCDG